MNLALIGDQKSVFLVPSERAIELTSRCAFEISKAVTVSEAKQAMTAADAIAALVRAMDVNDTIRRKAEFLQVRAERRLGEITGKIPSGERARPQTTLAQHNEILRLAKEGVTHTEIARRVGVHKSTVFHRIHGNLKVPSTPTVTKEEALANCGISISQANRAERLAKVPVETFEAVLERAPNKTRAIEEMGIKRYQRATRKAVVRVAYDALALLRVCLAETRSPRENEIHDLEARLSQSVA